MICADFVRNRIRHKSDGFRTRSRRRCGESGTRLNITIAAFSYPLGNRKMLVHCKEEQLSTTQRVFRNDT
ncbi:MAG: multidrug resistance efflux transporter family protein [Streptococcus parasanguinis]